MSCRDCKEDKEIVKHGRCITCNKEYNRLKSAKHFKTHGTNLLRKICNACKTEYLTKSRTSCYCEKCNVYFISPNPPYDPTIGGNKNYYYNDSVVQQIGMSLPENVILHHIDGDNTHNDFSNMALMHISSHLSFHQFLKHMNVLHGINNIPMTDEHKLEYLKFYSEKTKEIVGIFVNDDNTPAVGTTIRPRVNGIRIVVDGVQTREYVPNITLCIDCQTPVDHGVTRCGKCYKLYIQETSNCPPREQLEHDLKELVHTSGKTNFCAIGRKYNVCDNAVRKWAKKYNLI